MIAIRRTTKMNKNYKRKEETLIFTDINDMEANMDKMYVRELLEEGAIYFQLITNEGFGTLSYKVITA